MKDSSVLDRLMMVCMVALVGVVPLVYSSKVTEITLYPKFLALTVILSIMILLWLVKIVRLKQIPNLATPLSLPILMFFISNVASLNAAVNVYAAIFPLAHLAVLSILFFAVFNNLKEKWIHTILMAWVAVGGIVGMIGIGQYLGLGFEWIPTAMNPSATFANRNVGAMFTILTLPPALYLLFASKKLSHQMTSGAALTLLSVYLIYTRSRGAWVGLSGALMILFFVLMLMRKHRREVFAAFVPVMLRKRKTVIALFCLGLVAVMSSVRPGEKLEDTYGTQESKIMSTAASILKEGEPGRIGMWRASLVMLRDNLHWLSGVGLGNWHFNYPNYAKGHLVAIDSIPYRPHNDFLWILTETGIVGLGVYLWLLLTAAYMVLGILRKCDDGKTALLTITMGTSLLAILGHSLFSFPKERITPSMLFWLLLAIITRIHENLPTAKKNSVSPRVSLAIITVFILVSAVSVEVGRRHHLSDAHYRRALLFPEGSGEGGRLPELRQADHYVPHNWRTAFYFGLDYFRQEDYAQAVYHFKRCLNYSPYFLNAHYNLGLTYYQSGDYANAIRHFGESKRIGPTFTRGIYNLALSWHKAGRLEEAEVNYRTVLALDPNHDRAHNNLGVILKGREEYEEAAAHFRKALEIDPDFPQARENLDSVIQAITPST